jgi:hypothetical protein
MLIFIPLNTKEGLFLTFVFYYPCKKETHDCKLIISTQFNLKKHL